MNRASQTVCLFFCCLLGLTFGARECAAEEAQAKPSFALRDTDGVVRRLAEQRGKWVVLEWVNFDCAPVKALYQAPAKKMQALQRAVRTKGVVWFSINSARSGQLGHFDAKQGKAALARLGAMPSALLLDSAGTAAKTFRVRVTPEVRVVSPRGEIVYAGSVESSGRGARVPYLENVLKAALGGQPIPYATQPVQGCRIESSPTAAPGTVSTGGPTAPDFTLVDTKGVRHRLSDYRGKWVILEWMNLDCPFVKKQYDASHRSMQLLQARAKRLGMVWLMICSSAQGKQGHLSSAQVNARLRSLGSGPAAYLFDPNGAVGRSYRARTTPDMRVISPQGTIEYAGAIDSIRSMRASDVPQSKNYVRLAIADIVARRPIATKKSKPYGCSVKY